MMNRKILSCSQKALAINLDNRTYGTFAEIGAGQEVARHFFTAGGAAGTIAKSQSAYDMMVSDAIYGKVEDGRYVSENRVLSMLDHEQQLMKERLTDAKYANKLLFVFANTVTTKSYSRKNQEAHGWMGLRYQRQNEDSYNDFIAHFRLLDNDHVMQQQMVGLLGVNFIYAIFHYLEMPNVLVESLFDNIPRGRVEVDMIECNGPDCEHIDNRLLSLQLVKLGLTPAILFDRNGHIKQAADVIYKKTVLIQRGSFRPVTLVNMDMQNCALAKFAADTQSQNTDPYVVMEITLHNLLGSGKFSEQDFLDRINLLTALKSSVIITNFSQHYEFAAYVSRNCKNSFALVLGIDNLRETLDEKYYDHLDGGILEACGKLFSKGCRLYIYPRFDKDKKILLCAANLEVAPNLTNLFRYLLDNNYIVDLTNCDVSKLAIFSQDVLDMIQTGERDWEQYVPDAVAHIIKDKGLWQGNR